MAMAEITIIGAGIFGLSAAYVMAQRGAKVTIVERDHIGAGASGGVVGALAPHVPELWNTKKAFQLESLLMAQGFWDEVAAFSGVNPGYARLGRVQPIPDTAALDRAHERIAGAEELWQGQATWQVLRLSDTPGLSFDSPTGWAIYDTLTARQAPRASSHALATGLRRMNATFLTGDQPPDGAQKVLWASGVQGLLDLGEAMGKMMGNGVKGQAALLDADYRDAPQLFIDGLHIVPHADGTTAVGSTSERYYSHATHTDEQLETLIGRARAACPNLKDAAVLERWASLRPRSPTRAPMLGEWPDRPGHFILNGGFKIGYGMAPKLAHLAADLLLEGEADIPEGFRVTDNLPRKKGGPKNYT
ncbi:NAD(P)/FAD-dependent oxidoreductase [Pararhodobacter oceanensis]|uniref:NAD(P)/FAD-dependent oxidoreductase n=1 Tax=Pararhodobacter oceanensis TaxID=2172121 RepID=UPI003A90C662